MCVCVCVCVCLCACACVHVHVHMQMPGQRFFFSECARGGDERGGKGGLHNVFLVGGGAESREGR